MRGEARSEPEIQRLSLRHSDVRKQLVNAARAAVKHVS